MRTSFLFLLLILPTISLCRPPHHANNVEIDQQQTNNIQDNQQFIVDYFEDFVPVLTNSTKLHENYHLEKKKYLTSVLGFPEKIMKMR